MLKSEKGAVTMVIVVSIIFLITFGMIMYANSIKDYNIQTKTITAIQKAYYPDEVDLEGMYFNVDNSIGVLTDNINPTIPLAITKIQNINSIEVTASGSTDVESGIAGYKYSLDGINWTEMIASGTSHIFDNIKSGQEVTIYAKAVDNALKESEIYSTIGNTNTITGNVIISQGPDIWTSGNLAIEVSYSGTLPSDYVIQYREGADGTWVTGTSKVITSNKIVYGRLYNSSLDDAVLATTKSLVKIDGSWDGEVNTPKLVTGMIPIYFSSNGTENLITGLNQSDWYDYSAKKWANAKSVNEEGQTVAYWVWIPRYEYILNTGTQTANVKFIPVTTVETNKDAGYTHVHPAFINDVNLGGWDRELPGIWVAKFMAGYPMEGKNIVTNESITNANQITPVYSTLSYTETTALVHAAETGGADESGDARNYLSGIYGDTSTIINYPVFLPKTVAMNYINHNDAYRISDAMDSDSNIYRFDASANTHLMKNSEWGAVSYLTKSQYGLGSADIYINDVSLNNQLRSSYGLTGYAGASTSATNNYISSTPTTFGDTISGNAGLSYAWNTINGKRGSSTGNIHGIYDLSGCLWEREASYVTNGNANLSNYGSSIVSSNASTKDVIKYTSYESSATTLNEASQLNWVSNEIYGDATKEVSTGGAGAINWYDDYSYFPGRTRPFFMRGGCYNISTDAGVFAFGRHGGNSSCNIGFRAVVCP